MDVVGVASALGASVLFGSVFVPIKRQPTGDGFFAQMIMALGGFVTSIAISGLVSFPPVYPFAMVGGAIWCISNAFAIKLMSILGMALSILIWNTTSCLTGWAIARFGLFGISPMEPASNLLNAIGVSLLIVGGILYLFITSEVDTEGKGGEDIEKTESKKLEEEEEAISFSTRIIAMVAAMVSGTFYGSMSAPITYMQQHPFLFEGGSPSEGLPYVFSFFCGVIVTAVVVFVVYSLKTRSPYVEGAVIVPALCSGVIFCLAMSLFFTAIEHLSQTIAYPVCSMLPGLVVSAWSVLYFREISGRRNLTLLAVAYSITLVGVLLVAISRDFSF